MLNSSDTATVFWEPVDTTNEEHLDFLNSYDFLSYDIAVEPVYSALSQSSATTVTVMKPGDNTTFTLTGDGFLVFKVGVSVTNDYDTGPKKESCFVLGENGKVIIFWHCHFSRFNTFSKNVHGNNIQC